MTTDRLKQPAGVQATENTPQPADKYQYCVFEHPSELKSRHPGWHALHKMLSAQNMPSDAVCKYVGLTPRQINDWDSRNYIGCAREGRLGWRRFSALDMFALAVLKYLKTRNLPLSLFVDEHHGHFINLPNTLWLAMPYLIDGRKATFGKNLGTGQILAPICESVREQYPSIDNSATYLMIGLQPIAQSFFSKVRIPGLNIQIDGDSRYSFEIDGKGLLTLEKLNLEGWA